MTPYSLPPSDRDVADGDPDPSARPITPSPAPAPVISTSAALTKTYVRNEKVLQKLEAWLATFEPDDRPTNVALARSLSYSDGVLSQYRAKEGNKYAGDTKKLERAIELFLRSESRRLDHDAELIRTKETRMVMNTFELIKTTDDVGVIFAPAGYGKTSGCKLWCLDDPTALFLTLDEWGRGPRALENKMWDLMDFRRSKDRSVGVDHSLSAAGSDASVEGSEKAREKRRRQSRGEYLVEKLNGSRRLVIIDNAHKATAGAIRWVFDFYDATRCPVALVGNPELMDLIVDSDQRFSRVGIRQDLRIANPENLVRHMINKVAPHSGDSLVEPCIKVASNQGHYRAVSKQLSLAAKIMEGQSTRGKAIEWAEAFKFAHQKLIRGYEL